MMRSRVQRSETTNLRRKVLPSKNVVGKILSCWFQLKAAPRPGQSRHACEPVRGRNAKTPIWPPTGGTSKTWWRLVFEQIDGAAEGWRKLLGKPCHTSRMGGNRPRSVAATVGERMAMRGARKALRPWCARGRSADGVDIRARDPGTLARGHFTGTPARCHGACTPRGAGAQGDDFRLPGLGCDNALHAARRPPRAVRRRGRRHGALNTACNGSGP